jgi:hypothetical protein
MWVESLTNIAYISINKISGPYKRSQHHTISVAGGIPDGRELQITNIGWDPMA